MTSIRHLQQLEVLIPTKVTGSTSCSAPSLASSCHVFSYAYSAIDYVNPQSDSLTPTTSTAQHISVLQLVLYSRTVPNTNRKLP